MSSSSSSSPANSQQEEQALFQITAARNEYYEECEKEVPSLQKIFDCALRLQENAGHLESQDPDEVWEEAARIFEDLAERKFNQRDCYINMAKCYYSMGEYTKSRQWMEVSLEIDPEFKEALEFQQKLQHRVVKESKLVLYGLAGLLAVIGLFLAFRRFRAFASAIPSSQPSDSSPPPGAGKNT